MLLVKSNVQQNVRFLQTSTVSASKISKRRKDTKLKESPNLRQKKLPKTNKDLALDFFDSHYKQIYGSDWHKIRLALLCKPKFAALVNNFSPKEEVIEELKSLGCVSLRDVYNAELAHLPQSSAEDENPDTEVDMLISQLTQSSQERPSLKEVEDEDTDKENVIHGSMTKTEAQDRLVDPEDLVIGGKISASMYEFVPPDKTAGMEDFIEESDYFKEPTKTPANTSQSIKEKIYDFPPKLEVFFYPDGIFHHFREPRRLYDGPFNYYCMDAASILPVLMLNLQKGDELLDLCAGPGGKSLVAMQTLRPHSILCNDLDRARLLRVKRVMSSFLLDKFNQSLGHETLQFMSKNGVVLPEVFECKFDKVLCDVPCFTDRHAVSGDDSFNLFSPQKAKERLRMPGLQASLLVAAIKCTKPGGYVVYSTCTLSPMQNDGVVAMALKLIWEETDINVVVCDLSHSIDAFKACMNFSTNLKVTRFGQQVVPSLDRNFGPMYFAKIKRLS